MTFTNASLTIRFRCVMSVSPRLIFRKKVRQRDGIVLQDLADAITLDVKPKRRSGKPQAECGPGSKREDETCAYNYINTDIWFSIAEHINPEDVCNFALICRQTAYIVTKVRFWTGLYRRFYNKDKHLPDNLEINCLNNAGALRSKVICSLFYLYTPFIERIKLGYDLSFVNGLKYINSWHKKESNVWLFCYKFWNHAVPRRPRESYDESDADEDDLSKTLSKLNNLFENPHDGISLLVICSRRFIPFPTLHGTDMILRSTRQLLASDLKGTNLELQFMPSRHISGVPVEVVYPAVLKYKVIPWWHPDYKIFLFDEKPSYELC